MALSGSAPSSGLQRRVGLLYDERMCRHFTPDGSEHPECPDRIRAIWRTLHNAGIPQRCILLNAKPVDDKHLLHVHSKQHIDLIKCISSKKLDNHRHLIARQFTSIYFNEGSSEAAYLSAGSVIEVAERVAQGELHSAFAIVRPPGHHAEKDEPMGFCLLNNVAVAATYLLNERTDLGIKKILIIDWDVHHGNGTQKMFWDDSRVLFFSVHRHEFGTFYPATDDGSYTMTGEDLSLGYNINVPWENARCGDADYLAVWDHVLIPVAKEFNPDIIIISAGFDAAIGDPLGGCSVTPYGYSLLLKKLMDFASGKIVMALEGGYNLDSIASSALACVKVLLQDEPISGSSEEYPLESTWHVIRQVRNRLSEFWPVLAAELPKKPIWSLIQDKESEDVSDLLKPLSAIKIGEEKIAIPSVPWRQQLSQVYIWYAAYGSNMYKPRFLCYIEGGQVDGMRKPCSGCVDRSPPKDIKWKTFPHRLFFGRDYTVTWGHGGVAFLHPQPSNEEKTYMCLYKITLEQFNDVLIQENVSRYTRSSPLVDSHNLNFLPRNHSFSVDVIKNGWYHDVLYLGKEEGIPVIAMTCSVLAIEEFKSGKVPVCSPSLEYSSIIIKGLVEGNQLSEEAAEVYVKEAYSKLV